MRRVIGIDIHRTFGEVVIWENGVLRHAGRVDMTRTALEGFGKTLEATDEVVIEATGNSMAVSRVLSPFVARVVIANPLQVKAIAHAHVKTDKVDAGTLASLYAAGYLPEIWTPDAATERLRRLVARRYQVVRHRTRVKNEVHAILHAHLDPEVPARRSVQPARPGLAGAAGWCPTTSEPRSIAHIRELDRLTEDLADLDREIALSVMDDASVRRLMTITGVNLTVAVGLMAAIGDIARFKSPAEAGELLRAEPARPPVGSRRRPSRPHQQGRPQPRPRHAGRGGLGGGEGAGTAARLLRAHPGEAGPPDRGGRARPQARPCCAGIC